MRIKSYFAPSVQAAIALARKEFGDDVTLVTSHVASLDNRHLGQYEVVFAVEEVISEEVAEEQPAVNQEAAVLPPPPPEFNRLLQQAMETPAAPDKDSATRLEEIYSSLVALGLEAALVRSFMTMLKAVLPSETAVGEPIPVLPVMAEEKLVPNPPVIAPPPVLEAELPPPPSKPKITVLKPAPTAATPRPFLSLFETARPEPKPSKFSAAELAFMSSVSSPKQEQD